MQVLDLWTRQEVLSLSGHSWPVVALSFIPSGRVLASTDVYSSVRFWDVSQGTQTFIVTIDVVSGGSLWGWRGVRGAMLDRPAGRQAGRQAALSLKRSTASHGSRVEIAARR
jgi:WD40 repeat protein